MAAEGATANGGDADWDPIAQWWVNEIGEDPSYQEDIVPLAVDLCGASPGRILDLGCGEGQLSRAVVSGSFVGCDLSMSLLQRAADTIPVVRAHLPDLRWVRPGAFDTAVAVMVLEHLPSHREFLVAAAHAVRRQGALVVVMNHPAYTAPGAGPIVDQTDGEVLWRWGPYFESGSSVEPAGPATMTFHHRPLGTLLTDAAAAGWTLQRMEERSLGPTTVGRLLGAHGHEQIPRLLGIRWVRSVVRA